MGCLLIVLFIRLNGHKSAKLNSQFRVMIKLRDVAMEWIWNLCEADDRLRSSEIVPG